MAHPSITQSNYASDGIDFDFDFFFPVFGAAHSICTRSSNRWANIRIVMAREFIGDVEYDSIAESKPDIQSMGKRMNRTKTRPSVILIRNICFHSAMFFFFSRSIQIGVYASGCVCHHSLDAEIKQQNTKSCIRWATPMAGADNGAQTETLHRLSHRWWN